MAHIRILRHYIHTPFLMTAGVEAVAIALGAYTGYATRYGAFPGFSEHAAFAIVFAAVLTFFNVAMGVHEARLREGYVGVMLRTAVAFFLLGTLTMAVILYFAPNLSEGRGVLLFSTIEAYVFVAVLRWGSSRIIDEDFMKRRVLVLGTGQRALKIASRMRRRSDRRAFVLLGFVEMPNSDDVVSTFDAKVLPYPNQGFLEYCEGLDVDEIVVASDDRRAQDSGVTIPFDELMDCRLSGIEVCEVQNFVEREAGKLDVDLLQRSWMVYSDGFNTTWYRAATKRLFDIVTSVFLIVVLSPVMLLTALSVYLCEFKRPIFYRQTRVGLDGRLIRVIKFRTMRADAEDSGAVWADHNDPRTTKVGQFLRTTRLDELPQLFNVLAGQMSMVGPRPERPVFVDHLAHEIEYYAQRHRIKPGLTGWAQLCYPYGASVQDAKEKLQYDLYYLKNHSILLDMIILLQTIEVVLVGEGAR